MISDDTRPDIPAVLSAASIARYMRATGWEVEGKQGTYGSVFTKGGGVISVPHEDDDPDAVRMSLYRLAVAEKREAGETEAAIRSYRDARAATKPCGCGPLEPCGEHLWATPLVMPADEFAAVGTVAEVCGSTITAGAPEVASPADAPAERSGTATGPAEGDWRERAGRAEAKLAEVRSVLLEGGQGDATARRRAIAIVGTGATP
jgi:hypothetical protein